jgi:glycosyltransferase involved in cell wall biosynthesis
MLVEKPTGITNYTNNILPYLLPLNPKLLIAEKYQDFTEKTKVNNNSIYHISEKLSPDYRSKGHFYRLTWTQFKLPQIYHNLQAKLLFSPVPEAPLLSKCRSIIMVHDLIPIRFPKPKSPLNPYFRYYIPQVCQQAQHIICNSQATASDLIDYFKIPASKITPIHLAVDNSQFKVINSAKQLNKLPYFLYIGRHDPHKNVPKIIDAFAQLPNNKDYELWLVGPPDDRYTPYLEQQAKELKIHSQVKFLNYVSSQELPIIINQAISLVFPTLWEGFGFPILEAMACGTPVITSNISSLPEVAGDAAILVNPHRSQEISNAMYNIATDEKMRQQLRDLGLKRAKKFSWKNTGIQTKEIINKYV